MNLSIGLFGPDLTTIFRKVRDAGVFGSGRPAFLLVDNRKRTPSVDWLEKWIGKAQVQMFAAWDNQNFDHFLSVHPGTIVKAGSSDFPCDLDKVMDLLRSLPFTLASFESLFKEWYAPPIDYRGWGFADLHFPHGWACAFREDGHKRLVSRRWLDFGPWRVLRTEPDITLVQFHDLSADSKTALEQSKPGHERMGISDIGGFLQTDFVYKFEIGGLYIPSERKLKIVVHRRELSQLEMLNACATRYYQALGPDRPLDSIAYVFMEEEYARRHLHELWLRELECWTIIKGREVRIDSEYHPVPVKPDWVRQLEQE